MLRSPSLLRLLLAATAAYASYGFTCTWRGSDYSWYTYRFDFPNTCHQPGCTGTGCTGTASAFCNNEFYEICGACGGTSGAFTCCDDPFSKQYERETMTKCCQCAGDTVYNPITNTNDYALTAVDCGTAQLTSGTPGTIGQIEGCDGFKPEIFDSEAAAQARTPGQWFTSAAQLSTYLAQTIICEDDCWEMPSAVNDASVAGPGPFCRFTWTAGCDNTLVTTNAMDRCGNLKTSTFRVRFDDAAPSVNVTLGAFTQSKIKTNYETIPVTVAIADNCDPNALTSIQVLSDEAPLTHKYEKSAVLGRVYASNTVAATLTGWTVTLNRNHAWKPSLVNTEFATPNADGRFYIVRVCAMDLAGNRACNEAAIAVPPKGVGTHKVVPVPVNSGKLYTVAQDVVYWNRAQDDLPFRLRNTGLNL